MELQEELPEPTSFSNIVAHDVILSLDAQSGDDVLALRGPGDEVVIEEHGVVRGGPTCIQATHLVRIHVERQLKGGGQASQVEAKVQGIMHMKANLLDGVGDVGAGERQVLEGPGKAPELSWISNRRPESGGV
jgi:hypothetical protein